MGALAGRIKRLDRRLGRCLGCPACGIPLGEQQRQSVIEACLDPLTEEQRQRRIDELFGGMQIEDKGLERQPTCPVCAKQIGEERRKQVADAHRKPMSTEEIARRIDELFGLTGANDKQPGSRAIDAPAGSGSVPP